MREEFTIGEIAKSLNISTHQIRYYEEKGVINPKKDEENGYRLYGLNEVYKLAHILLLRKLNISVPEIRKCFKNHSNEQFFELLQESSKKLDQQIQELMVLKEQTNEILNQYSDYKKNENKYIVKSFEERFLKELFTITYDQDISEREILNNLFKESKDIIEQDIVELYDKKKVTFCVKTAPVGGKRNIILKEGQYLCYNFITNDEDDFEYKINGFIEHAKKAKLKIKGRIIVIESTMISIFSNTGIKYEIQALLKRV